MLNDNYSNTSFSQIINLPDNTYTHRNFAICISPIQIDSVHLNSFNGPSEKQIFVGKKTIDSLFFKYVNRYRPKDWTEINSSSASFKSVKKLITDLL